MTDILDRLAASDPAVGYADYDELTARRLLDGVLAQPQQPTLGRRGLVIAAAATVPLAATGLLWAQVLPPGPTPSAAETLNATASAMPADPVARPGQFWRIETRSIDVSSWCGSGNVAVTSWLLDGITVEYVSADGHQPNVTVRQPQKNPRLLGGDPSVPVDKAYYSGNKREVLTYDITDSQLNPNGLVNPTPAYLATLPLQTGSLSAKIDELAAALRLASTVEPLTVDESRFSAISTLLTSGRAASSLRSALLRVAATIPGLTTTPNVSVLGGPRGTAVGLTSPKWGVRYEFVVDAARGEYLGSRYVYVAGQPTIPAGTTREDAVTRTLVDEVPREIRDAARLLHCEVESVGFSCRG